MDLQLEADLAYMSWLAGEEKTRQKNITLMRNYYAGEHDVKLTDRQKEFLGHDEKADRFSVNYCKIVVDAVVERLLVRGFQSGEDAFSDWCWQVWKHNRMDAKQRDVHQGVVNEAEFFVQVDLPEGDPYPTLILYPRYVDPINGGTGSGCKAFYTNDDPNQPLERISRRWTEQVLVEGQRSKAIQRMNVYYNDRTERYILKTSNESGWAAYDDDGEEPVILRLDARGEPLGIPFAHFRKTGTYELWDAITPQDMINKSGLDIIATVDSAGFPIRKAKGVMPTTDGKPPNDDGSNYTKLFPGAWLGPLPEGADVEFMQGADVKPLLDTGDWWIIKLAQVTNTPIHRFQLTGQIAAEGTLKQQEEPLLAKCRAYGTLIGNAWEDVFYIARRLANARAAGLPEDAILSTQWEPFETRDEGALLERLKIKRESLEVPVEMLWEEAGYDADKINRMKAMRSEKLQSTSNLGGELLRNFENGGFGDV